MEDETHESDNLLHTFLDRNRRRRKSQSRGSHAPHVRVNETGLDGSSDPGGICSVDGTILVSVERVDLIRPKKAKEGVSVLEAE